MKATASGRHQDFHPLAMDEPRNDDEGRCPAVERVIALDVEGMMW